MSDNELLTLLTEQMAAQAVLLDRANFLLQTAALGIGWLCGAFAFRMALYSAACREYF